MDRVKELVDSVIIAGSEEESVMTFRTSDTAGLCTAVKRVRQLLRKRTFLISIIRDPRNPEHGWSLMRLDDNVRVDFRRVHHPRVTFVYPNGFLAKVDGLFAAALDVAHAAIAR